VGYHLLIFAANCFQKTYGNPRVEVWDERYPSMPLPPAKEGTSFPVAEVVPPIPAKPHRSVRALTLLVIDKTLVIPPT